MLLFEAVSGSRLYGTYRENSDHDRRGVFLYSHGGFLGLQTEPDTCTSSYRDGNTIYDIQHHELKKFCRLALNGNPGMLEMLFTPEHYWIFTAPAWSQFYKARFDFLSRRLIRAYGGFMLSEVSRLRQNPEDDKKRRNLIRLAMQAYTICTYGDFSPALNEDQLYVLEHENTIFTAESFVTAATKASEETRLPEEPNTKKVHALVQEAYYDHVIAYKTL